MNFFRTEVRIIIDIEGAAEQLQEINAHIIEELHRTATVIDGKGAYLKDDTTVLLCVVRKPQFYQLKKFVAAIDPKAFVIITEATQIIGAGFKPIDSEN